jgi:hypothetical protein
MAKIGTRFAADFTELEVVAVRDVELGQEVQIRYLKPIETEQSAQWYPVWWLDKCGWVERGAK